MRPESLGGGWICSSVKYEDIGADDAEMIGLGETAYLSYRDWARRRFLKTMEDRGGESKMVRDVDDGAPFIGGVPRAGYRRESMDRFSEVMQITVMVVAAATTVYLVCVWIGRLVL